MKIRLTLNGLHVSILEKFDEVDKIFEKCIKFLKNVQNFWKMHDVC